MDDKRERAGEGTKHDKETMKFVVLLAALPVLALTCADGYNTWLDGRCFRVFYPLSVGYSTALDQCARDDAQLPAIKSKEDNDQIFAALSRQNSFASFSFWLSLICDGFKFVWADGQEAEYTNFADNYTCSKLSTDRRYYIDHDRLWYEADGRRFDYPVNSVVCKGPQRSMA